MADERMPTVQEADVLLRLQAHANTHDTAEDWFWYRPDPDERWVLADLEKAQWAFEWLGTWTITNPGVAALARYQKAKQEVSA